jgi:hypothetical protein
MFVDGKNYFPGQGYASLQEIASGAAQEAIIQRDQKLKHFPIGYVFLVYDNLPLLKRVLDRFYQKDVTTIMIHVDKKAAKESYYDELQAFIRKQGWTDVYFTSKRTGVSWGHSSILSAQQLGIYELSQVALFDHVIILGTDYYPLVTPKEMNSSLAKYPGFSWVGSTPLHKTKFFAQWQWNTAPHIDADIKRTKAIQLDSLTDKRRLVGHILPNQNGVRLPKNQELDLFKDTEIVGGYQWVVLSRQFVNSMFASPHAASLAARFEWTFAPEEFFYQTWAAKFLSPKYYSNKELKILFVWPFPHGANPIVFTDKHLNFIRQGRRAGKLYMRKVSEKHPAVMRMIDEEVFGMTTKTKISEANLNQGSLPAWQWLMGAKKNNLVNQ